MSGRQGQGHHIKYLQPWTGNETCLLPLILSPLTVHIIPYEEQNDHVGHNVCLTQQQESVGQNELQVLNLSQGWR